MLCSRAFLFELEVDSRVAEAESNKLHFAIVVLL